MGAPEVEFAFIGGPFVKARYVDGMVELDGCLYDEVCPAPCVGGACFELRDVAMGIGFHWERRETQRFSGGLRLIPDRGRGYVVAVNVVGIEEYLKSVISSEMSAGSSAALLRSHAVVSRSWLLRQLADRGKHTCAQPPSGGALKLTVRRWMNLSDGMTGKTTPCSMYAPMTIASVTKGLHARHLRRWPRLLKPRAAWR